MTNDTVKDLRHLLSAEAKARTNSKLKSAFKYFSQPGMTYLGGGLPHPDYFPFDKISADIPISPFADGTGKGSKEKTIVSVEVNKNKEDNVPKQVELARSLQYGLSGGQPEIIDFLKEHTDIVHRVPYEDWGLIASVGNTQSWDATVRTFCNKGDIILVEDHSFSSAIDPLASVGVHAFPLPMDAEGLIPEKASEILDNWVGPKPKLLYTIPTGQNPTGSSISPQRRKQIYDLAVKHDFIIVEDEPYYFLQMETYTTDVSARSGKAIHSKDQLLKAMVPSYLSMDVEGRVIRLDSLSKVIAPGVRFGWIVAQNTLVERFLRLHESTIQSPCGFSTSILNALFQKWGQEGYLDWLISLRAEYTHRRDVAIDSINEYFPKEVVTHVPPVAGMFFTTSIDASKHPKFKTEFGEDPLKVETAIYEQAIAQGSLMVPGSWFKVKSSLKSPVPVSSGDENSIFFRGTYAASPLDELRIGLEKFGKAIKIEFGLL